MLRSPIVQSPAAAHTVLIALLTVGGCAGPGSISNPAPSAATMSSTERRECTDGIFSAADGEKIDVRKDPALVRQRAVRIDFTRLTGSAPRLTLNLFDDVCLVAVRDRAGEGAPEGQVWTGTIEGVTGSSVTLVTESRAVMGNVVSPPRTYQIRVLRDGVHLVNEVDPSKYPNEKNPGR